MIILNEIFATKYFLKNKEDINEINAILKYEKHDKIFGFKEIIQLQFKINKSQIN